MQALQHMQPVLCQKIDKHVFCGGAVGIVNVMRRLGIACGDGL